MPNIEKKKSATLEVSAYRRKRCHQFGISQLITEYREHHQHCIEPTLQIETANIRFAKIYREFGRDRLCFGASHRQHLRRAVNAEYQVSALRQPKRVTAGTASKI